MKIWRVGGSVRDELLGLPVKDRDWVVVGATPQQMVDAGYKPVGKDFPVFLHPDTREEYALARTERKTAPGYRGFTVHAAPGVTLEEDLGRRDLTINAIAVSETGERVDPFGGVRDLRARVLRHVGEAFVEDPVRILRTARFAARLEGFEVAPATMRLMRAMSAAGEVDALVAERVWQELARGLMAPHPVRMIEVLEQAGAWERLFAPLAAPDAIDRAALARGAGDDAPLEVRFAVLTAKLQADALRALCERYRVPVECREVAIAVAREHARFVALADAAPAALLAMLERNDAFRRAPRFNAIVQACEILAARAPDAVRAGTRIAAALSAAGAIDQGAIARAHAADAGAIKAAIAQARIAAIDGCPR
ncbi:MAG: multifunctional CCA tRNA nucleotidyl transferase/2'3'-cyclic phosphodiesterase/2'nucleotidase/phosphatase [Lautropia sp.]